MKIKAIFKKYIPKKVLNLRHLFFAWLGALWYGHPSEELMVIGITGTSGKSTTAYLLRQLLEHAGYTVGSLSTIDFYIAGEEKLNDKKMTMLGKMQIQKYLRRMVEKGCNIAIIETTSEGRVQHRHRCINYDMMLLTNLYPEHIDSHGSFENYMQAKIDLFDHVARSRRKTFRGEIVKKTAIINIGVKDYAKFIEENFDEVVEFGDSSALLADCLEMQQDGIHFRVHDRDFFAPMYGVHNAMNIIACMAVARVLDISWGVIQDVVRTFHNVPGRIEFIKEAEEKGFQIIVDYAFEPEAMKKLYDVVSLLKPKRVIHVFGSTGGGRDKERRFTVGSFVGKHADICIVTDEDPYDDNPIEIMNHVASSLERVGKEKEKTLFIIPDRRNAIQKALSISTNGDIVLITGKGSEQAMVVKGTLIPWDDRNVVKELLQMSRTT